MELQAGFFCLGTEIQNGRISIRDILDEIVVKSLPAPLAIEKPVLYVTLWHNVTENIQPLLQVRVNERSFSFPAPEIRPHFEKALYVISLAGLQIEEAGLYHFRLMVEGEAVTDHERTSHKKTHFPALRMSQQGHRLTRYHCRLGMLHKTRERLRADFKPGLALQFSPQTSL